MLSPIRFAHSSTSLTVPERSRREGRLFACHSERSEESLSFRAQGRLREASRSGLKSMRGILLRQPPDQNDNVRQLFISLLNNLDDGLNAVFLAREVGEAAWDVVHREPMRDP